MLEIIRIDNLLKITPREWNDLLSQNETNAIFLTHQWISCWMNSLGESKELFVLAAKEDDRLVGIAPLMIWRKKYTLGTARTLEFIGMGESDYCDFIAEPEKKPEIVRAFLKYINENHREWDIVSLDNIPEHSSTSELIRSYYRKSRMKLSDEISIECPLLIIRGNEEYARDCLRKKNVRVSYNQLSKSGKLEYHIAQNLDEIKNEIDRFFEFHEQRRFMLGDHSKFENGGAREFYQCLVERFSPEGWLRFDILKLDNEPVAYHFGFLYNDSLIYYTPTFNLAFSKRSPGTVLFKMMLEDSLTKNIWCFDFARGAEWYKERFSNEVRKNLRFEIYKSYRDFLFYRIPRAAKMCVKRKYPRQYSFLKSMMGPAKIEAYKQDLVFVVKRIGLLKAVSKIVAKMIRNYIYNSQETIVFKTYPGERSKPSLSDHFQIRAGKFSDLRDFIKSTPQEHHGFLVTALERISDGDRLYVAEKDGKVVHYAWAQFTKRINLPEVHSHIDLDHDVGYTFHGYTLDEFRGQGIYPAVMSRIIDDLEKEGAKEVYVYCVKNNVASRKSIERAGFKPFLIMGMTKIFWIIRRRTKHLNPPS